MNPKVAEIRDMIEGMRHAAARRGDRHASEYFLRLRELYDSMVKETGIGVKVVAKPKLEMVAVAAEVPQPVAKPNGTPTEYIVAAPRRHRENKT